MLAAPAQAHGIARAGLALERLSVNLAHTQDHHHPKATARPAPALPSCPPGDAVQVITLVDQTGQNIITPMVERALIDQSVQLHAAWNTPCVQFGPRGWNIYLQSGQVQATDGDTSYRLGGHHYGAADSGPSYAGQPYAIVQTGNLTWATGAARALSHELVEMLVDPEDETRWQYGLLEVCDPVEDLTYQLDGVPVSDFALPSYFNGGTGPWDEAGALTGAFSI